MTDDLNNALGHKLLALGGILLVGAVLFSFYYYLASSNPASARQWAAAMGSKNSSVAKPRAMAPDKAPDIVLKPMEEAIVGKIKLVYHGLADGNQVQISLALLELDPFSYYTYTIPLAVARQGFRLGGQPFRVVKARNSRLHLRWEK